MTMEANVWYFDNAYIPQNLGQIGLAVLTSVGYI